MICIGMSKEVLKQVPQYDGMCSVYTTTEEFYTMAYDPTTTVFVITDDFIRTQLGYDRLEDACADFQRVRPEMDIVLLGEAIEFEVANTYLLRESWMSPQKVTNTIANIHNRERSLMTTRAQASFRDFMINSVSVDDLIDYMLVNPVTSMKFLREMLSNYRQQHMDKYAISNQLAAVSLENRALSEKLAISDKNYNSAILIASKIQDKYNELVAKINYQYSVPYEELGNEGFSPEIISYNRIIYVKEISPVKYTQTMLYYLQQLMNTLDSGHTRSLIIERPGAYQLVQNLYPHHTPHYRLNHGDLKNADLVMVGYQKDIMSSVIYNTAQNKYLIIWDKTGADDMFIRNERIRPIYTMSDLADNEYYNYPLSNILSYSSETLNIGHVADFNKLSVQEKLKAYSEMPVIRNLLKALEV